MPSIIGPVKVTNVEGGVINFGDSFYISPKGTGKTHGGSGALNTGNFVNNNNGLSVTNSIDKDLNVQNFTSNK
jgi:spore germination protein PF